VTRLEAQARESFARDVNSVAGELADATTIERFADALAELLELASDCRVLATRVDDDPCLAVRIGPAPYLVVIEATRGLRWSCEDRARG
jgi:hypothetical protein